LKIIEGYESAVPVLSRQVPTDVYSEKQEETVRQIINEVRRRGDAALRDYALKFDGVKLATLEVDKQQVADAYREVSAELAAALRVAAGRIRTFHLEQKRRIRRQRIKGGSAQIMRPLERVGLYAPGGTASYPSTVLMTAVPAKVAGVKEIILVTPARGQGTVPAPTLVAADIAGVGRIFCIGGAQAVAALAFGTESVPRVDKICGPGNVFVTLAKKLVYGVVDIDGLQGPSEVLIIADETANPEYCAADILAQAEHDTLASAILVTTSRQMAEEIDREVQRQLKELSRQETIKECLESRGIIAVVNNKAEAIRLANLYAPEHLYLAVKDPSGYINKLTNAGCIVAGRNSTVVLGDYVAGPSHVLPTGGSARFSSPLNVLDFMKITSLVDIDESELKKLGATAVTIASAEGLDAHARAIEKRLEGLK